MAYKREDYENYIYEITTLLEKGEFYPKYSRSILGGKNDYKLSQIFTKKNYSTQWIDELEDCINALDTIVRNPRKFIVIEEDIVDISLARSISVESVKHLAQHTNLISSVTKSGMVLPSKILNTSKEESFEIYENRFIYTLLLKTHDFLTRRFDSIKSALMQSGDIGVEVMSEFDLDGHKVNFKLETSANFPFDTAVRAKSTGPSNVERLTRINSIFNDFLSSAFAKEMRSCALVRPPIQRTNVILKDPNFKKALVLWQFVESAETMEFKVETTKETVEMNPNLTDKYRTIIYLNTVMLQSIAAARDTADLKAEEEAKKDKTTADEFISKNIEDFVPDDFPHLKMDLTEVRRIYYKIPGTKTLKLTEISKMNAAIDRVLRQYKINTAKEDSARQQKLIDQQLKEEAEAKRIALREAKEEERAKKQAEKERIEAEKRAERERILAEKRAEKERIEAEKRAERERIAAEIQAEKDRIEAEKRAEEERIEAERLAEERRIREEKEREELARVLAEEEARRIAEEEAAVMKKRLEEEKAERERLIKEETERAAAQYKAERAAFWAEQKELMLRLLTEENKSLMTKRQLDALDKIEKEYNFRLDSIRKIEELITEAARVQHEAEIARIIEEAKTFRSENEIISIRADGTGNENLLSADIDLRKRMLKLQLELVKEKRKKAQAERKNKQE